MIRGIGLSTLAAINLWGWMPEVRAFDYQSATDELAQSLREDIQRQRQRAQRDEAEAARRDVDLSQFGTPVDEPNKRVSPLRSRRTVQCTTISLGGGDFATDCD
jgi:hypothetical protein